MMAINGQNMYATVPPTPGTPTSGQPRVAYQIQPTGQQFAYATQQPQQNQQNQQQWIAIQPQQMQQFSGQSRIIAQPIQRNVTHRFPPGYPQGHIQGTMIYAANVPGSPHPQRLAIRPQNITTQAQQLPPQQAPQTPGTPTTPTNIQTPTPAPQPAVIQSSGGYYPSPSQGYPINYPSNGGQAGFVQQRRQAASITQSPAAIRQFDPTNNAHAQGAPPSQPPPNPFSTLPTINGGQHQQQQRSKGIPPQQQISSGHFSGHAASQAGAINKQASFDMRSPSLISPNQPVQRILVAPTMQSHNVNQLTPRPQPQSLQHTLRMTPQIFYSEVQNNVPPELCFVGCYFVYAENPNSCELHTLVRMIRYYGGELDAYNSRSASEKATHIICDYGMHIPQILEQKNKRICTVAWVNDIIQKRKVEPPYKVCHLPSLLTRQTTITEKVISVTGFTEREVASIKFMTQVIGAKFTPFLSKHTAVLIAKSSNSPKVEKALKAFGNSVQIVNLSWLCDLYVGFAAPHNDISNRKYNVNNIASLEIGPVNLSKLHENVARMMLPWQYPLTITEEHLKRARELRALVMNDEMVFASIKYTKILSEGIVPNDDQIDNAVKVLKGNGCKPDLRIAFSGFNYRELSILTKVSFCTTLKQNKYLIFVEN
jgi:hypothetical protein